MSLEGSSWALKVLSPPKNGPMGLVLLFPKCRDFKQARGWGQVPVLPGLGMGPASCRVCSASVGGQGSQLGGWPCLWFYTVRWQWDSPDATQ